MSPATSDNFSSLDTHRTWRIYNVDDDTDPTTWVSSRLRIMLMIFCVSLFASSFPTLSRRIPGLRIPGVVFFIGKHFGTGVILSTAFVHLLQDSFEALLNPVVRERWAISNWVGMIVLGSLLLIFFVEYISTSFVDRLQSYSSRPPSPSSTPVSEASNSPACSPSAIPKQLPSPAPSPSLLPVDHHHRDPARDCSRANGPGCPEDVPFPLALPQPVAVVNEDVDEEADEVRSLTAPLLPPSTHGAHSTHLSGYGATGSGLRSHIHGRPRHAQFAHTFPRSSRTPHLPPSGEEIQTTDASEEIFAGGHHRHESRSSHAGHHELRMGLGWNSLVSLGGDGEGVDDDVAKVKRDRSGSGGVHVHVHAHKPGHRHRHGHSGHGHRHGHGHGHSHLSMDSWDVENGHDEGADEVEMEIGRKRQVVGILMLEIGIMLHSLVIGITLSITSGSEYTSLVTAIVFHQLFEGLSLGIRIATLPAAVAKKSNLSMLKPALALMFAVTTPVGIAVGLGIFEPGRSEGAKVTLMRGLMSALSAGMLIYAACVEMLAGDFVMDPHLWRSSIRRQVLALVSLLFGVATMGAVGILGE
ncbi:uncharacterized protein FIBRA_00500 [Fibroporia radiculosa]|uniref:Zinc/iron permease n=1 Tax=Fibroporia radiculosa TaxID=599839 RepID=J4HRQ2_9APHY|nr:uncharacterized protein FIBRA_00500 [Fibroporia radiculosa]CCL98502.1 predicted protein [Fibroporia radiculosa]